MSPRDAPPPLTDEELSRIRTEAMDFADIGLFRYRFSGEIVFMDSGALRLLDLEREARDPSLVQGRQIGELFEYLDEPGALRRTTRQEGRVRSFEYHYRTLLGRERWVYHHSYLVREPDGSQAVQVVCQDITALKLAERALADSEARYRGLVEQSLQGILVMAGDPSRAVFVNDRLLEILDLRSDQVVGTPPDDLLRLVHPEDRARAAAAIRQAHPTAPNPRGEDFRLLRSDGTTRWITALVTALQWDGEPAIQVAFIDVTDRVEAERRQRHLEAQMARAQRLESLGVLAGGIAHEFNNILTAVLGHAELVAAALPPGDEARFHVEEIAGAAERAAEICRQMMVYAGRSDDRTARVDLDRLVSETTRLIEVSIPKQAHLDVVGAGRPVTVMADPGQLRQVLINLITNASEALDGRAGSLRLTVGTRHCDQSWLDALDGADDLAAGRHAILEVSDTGRGMDAETLRHLFDPFFSTKALGRGLGLSTVHGIVRGHGGGIGVTSTPGRGSTFTVVLPLAEDAAGHAAERTPAAAAAAAGLSGTVLLVDDEAAVRQVATRLLARLGLRVIEAADGPAAVEAFRRHGADIDIVLLDYSIPGYDGVECHDRLRAAGLQAPVLFSSAYGEDIIGRLRGRDDVDFVQKPFRLGDLGRRIERLLAPSHPPSPS